MNASLTGRLDSLLPTLRGVSHNIAPSSPEHEPDDILNTIVLKLIERASRDPSFLLQDDSRLVRFCAWRGKHAAAAARTYDRFTISAAQDAQGDEFDGEFTLFDLVPDESLNPEDQYIETETIQVLANAVHELAPKDQTIVTMLYLGYSQTEIANEMGVDKSCISHRKSAFAKKLSNFLST